MALGAAAGGHMSTAIFLTNAEITGSVSGEPHDKPAARLTRCMAPPPPRRQRRPRRPPINFIELPSANAATRPKDPLEVSGSRHVLLLAVACCPAASSLLLALATGPSMPQLA